MTARMEACQRLLSRYESEGNDFLYSIFTGDGSWMRHYDPELKSQSLEHRHPPFPRKKTIQDSHIRRETPPLSLLGQQSRYSLAVHGQRYDDGLVGSGEDPQEVEERITRLLQGKTPKLVQHDDVRRQYSGHKEHRI